MTIPVLTMLVVSVVAAAGCGVADEGAASPITAAPATAGSPTPTQLPIDTLAGCPEQHPEADNSSGESTIEYVDFVRLNGRRYDRMSQPELAPDLLADVIGRVCFRISEMALDPMAQLQDGDAAYLPVGTELRAIRGANSDLRLGVLVDNSVAIYEVGAIEGAQVGADVIDLGGEITEIWIDSEFDGARITAITNSDIVGPLIDELAWAPVDLSAQIDRDGPRHFVELVRADGTTTTSTYWIDTGELWPGVYLPASWRTAIETALVGVQAPVAAPPITGTTEPYDTMPATEAPSPTADEASVRALAVVVGVEGELEQIDAENGTAHCIGRLERRGLCVNVPLPGIWNYWDLDAQADPGATDDEASRIAVELFTQLGVDSGAIDSVEPNGPLPQVRFGSGALVMVAEDGRIAMVTAPTSLLPAG